MAEKDIGVTTGTAVRFGSFRIDLGNEQLWKGAEPVVLRPKTFAVLRYLAENSGRLVTRDELVRAVWPHTHGAEKGPKRCILELRTALGDRAEAPQFIETVGRRGYRLIADLKSAPASPPTSVWEPRPRPTAVRAVEPARGVVVGRESELATLQRWLHESLQGERRVVFVSGEAGIGKTSLVETFVQEARAQIDPAGNGGAWIGRGQCIEQHGEGEAYLPLLEAMGRLAGEPASSLPELLRRHAPSWLAQLPSLRSGAEVEPGHDLVQGATRPRMLREIGDLIDALTVQAPVVLVLEDLHWSDYSTLDFLSSVAQRREPARLFVVATFRATATSGDHPLLPIVQELVSRARAHELPLTGLTESAVQQYLDGRFPRHVFSASLAHHLHRRTEGHPLFLVNLVDDLVAQEMVQRHGDSWASRLPPEGIGALVPENSRRLIEKQMGRLGPELQALLEAASVGGVEFAADAVASALEMNPEHVEQLCDDLVRQAVFLRRAGIHEWPDATVVTRYGFRHALYQHLWYERLPARRRQRLHAGIGERLERSFGHRAGEIAAELAVHFDEGRDLPRAVHYRQHAARNALQRSAHREAVDHLGKALALLAQLPDTPKRAQQELALQIVLGVPLTAIKGYAASEVERAYDRALQLSEQFADVSQIAQALLGLWVFHFMRADLHTARRLGERSLQQTGLAPAADLAVDAHNAVGGTLLWLGEPAAARQHLEQSLGLQRQRQRSSLLHDTTDPEVACLSNLAWALWHLGHTEQARQCSEEALALAQRLSQPYSLGYALIFAAVLHCFAREFRQARERAEAAIAIGFDQGFPLWSAMGSILSGWAAGQEGEAAAAVQQIRDGLAAFEAMGTRLGRTAFLSLLAETHAQAGDVDEALRVLAEARGIAETTGERLHLAEIHRLLAQLTLRRAGAAAPPPAAAAEAEQYLRQAIEVAAQQGTAALELRAALDLSRLLQAQRRPAAALELLSKLRARFGEEIDSADLRAAEALLQELKKRPRLVRADEAKTASRK